MIKHMMLGALSAVALVAAPVQAATTIYDPSTYTFTALTTGTYSIGAQGGGGGGSYAGNGGFGAIASATFMLIAGDQLGVTVGNSGSFTATRCCLHLWDSV